MREFFRKNKRILFLLLIALIGVSAFLFVRRTNATTASEFQTAKVERGNLTATIGATGTVRARQTAVLIWQAAGTVESVAVNVGDMVKANQVLAALAKTSLPQSVILAEADLASAQKSLDELTSSNTTQAQAVIDLRNAQDAYDKALNWREELNGKINIKKIVYKKFGNRTFPILKEYRGYADEGTIAKADEDLALAKAKLDDA